MNLCKKCEKEQVDLEERGVFQICRVMGDGNCSKHGRFSFYDRHLKERCNKCAKEKGICQKCGENI